MLEKWGYPRPTLGAPEDPVQKSLQTTGQQDSRTAPESIFHSKSLQGLDAFGPAFFWDSIVLDSRRAKFACQLKSSSLRQTQSTGIRDEDASLRKRSQDL